MTPSFPTALARARIERIASICVGVLLLSAVMAACGPSPQSAGTTASAPPSQPTETPTPGPVGPVKGLSDNPAFQWWRWAGGPQPDSWWGSANDPAALHTQTNLMRELGVKMFRVELVWAFVEPTMPGGTVYDHASAQDPNWSGYQWGTWDTIVDAALGAGLQLLPVVYHTPGWAAGTPITLNGGPNLPPQSPEYYGDFIHAAVTRYHNRIHYWELGNEPDFGDRSFKASLAQYVGLMLEPGYLAAKQADRHAKILLGGLAVDTHMTAMYAAGAGPYFDIASFHAYYTAGAGDSTALDHVRAAMRQNGDAAKPIWLTEFGIPTRDPATATIASEESTTGQPNQAKLISDVYANLGVQAIFFYELRDTEVFSGKGPIKWVFWGLLTRDFAHRKLGFDAFKAVPSPDLPR